MDSVDYHYEATITCSTLQAYTHLVEKITEYQADPTNAPITSVAFKPLKKQVTFNSDQVINL